MKLLIVATALLGISCSSLAIGQAKSATVQELTRIEKEITDGILKGDYSAFKRVLADGYVGTNAWGELSVGKAANTDGIEDNKLTEATVTDFKVHEFGDTAVATFTSTDKGTWRGEDISGVFRWMDVFVKKNGRWQLIASQATRVAKE